MSLTTYIVLAVEHDPGTLPEQWNWEHLADHPGRVDVLAHAQVLTNPENGLAEQVRERWEAEWLALVLDAPRCPRCDASRAEPNPECSLCFRRRQPNPT